jgi:hypothetical protein
VGAGDFVSKILKAPTERTTEDKITEAFDDLKNKAEFCGLHVSLTRDRVEKGAIATVFDSANKGFCIACGADVENIEPDARAYNCRRCGRAKVYGAEEVLFMLRE